MKRNVAKFTPFCDVFNEISQITSKSNRPKEIISFTEFLENIENKGDCYSFCRDYYIKSNLDDSVIKDYTEYRNAELNDNEKKIWQKINRNAEIIIERCWFLNVPNTQESLRATNRFLKGRLYSDVYTILRENTDIIEGLRDIGENKTCVLAAQNVFEKWALYKMLWFFSEKLGFVIDGTSISDEIKNYFEAPHLNTRKVFTMKKELNVDDGKRTITIELLPQAKISGGLKPDFVLVISDDSANGKKDQVFIMDTKYRDYNMQGFKQNWTKDLFNVSLYKYLCIIKGEKLQVSGVP